MFTLNRKGATTIVDGVLLSYLIEDDMEDPEVPTEHLHEEIHHHAEHSREKWVLGVALSSALLAGFAAVCSLMAGHHANEAMIAQIESTDQWGYYQSKGIKETALTSKAEILDALDNRDDVILGLLTGNVEPGARIKLTAAGIDPDRFKINAFGSDHEHRPELPAIAQRRAGETLGLAIAGDRVVVIGDTPADIECGRSLGAKAIGVASGHYTVEQLQAHRPYAVFASLRETSKVLETILNA